MNGPSAGTLSGRHVLIAVLAFFALVIAANGIFVAMALWSWSGLSTEDAYRRGLAYNETLAGAEAQRALGWRAQVALQPGAGGRTRLSVAIADRAGAPVDGLAVSGELRRPARADLDQAVELVRQGPGLYGVDADLPLPGQWDVRLRATSPMGTVFVTEERLWLP